MSPSICWTIDDAKTVRYILEMDPGTILEPHRRALQLHCYRMTGSLHDAEDLVQETLLRAWQKYGSFKGTSSVRTWLYRIATNVCLDALRKRKAPRRLRPTGPASDPRLAVGSPTDEANWLQPYPDSEPADAADGPEENLLVREKVSLAFCAALQLLPPRQRAILILTDVLDWKTAEAADLLGMSVPAAESALRRARVSLARQQQPGPSGSAAETAGVKSLLDRYMKAWEADDVDALVALLREDATLSMPPFPSWYQGRQSVHAILSLHPFGFGKRAGWRLLPTRANGQPAFVLYRADAAGGPSLAFGLMALEVAGSSGRPSVSALTIYKDPDLVSRFGFPPQTAQTG
jgi:RNA polymerase sigma-70 factor (ECF subfamily)